MVLGLILAILLGVSSPSFGQLSSTWVKVEPTKPAESVSLGGTDDRWEFGVVPYMWFISVDGDLTVKGHQVSVNASFGDIWDNLNFGLMGLLQVRKGRVGGYADILYARLESENGVGRRGTANSDLTLVIADVVGFYRLGAHRFISGVPTPSVTVDPYVGFRSWNARSSVNIRTPGPVVPTISVEERKVWFDAIAGFRSIWNFTKHWDMVFRTDVGGGSSDVTAQGLWTFGYGFEMFSANASVQLGYRALYVDYSDTSGTEPSDFGLNATIHGPIVGMTVTF